MSRELVDQAKDAFWAARDDYRTFSHWVEAALSAHIEATKRAHGLQELPPRPSGSLPTGRPIT